ncbi:MAG: ABC transporter permease [Flavobacteriales bacterium]|nr:ABC transporter permease [Flavobacteriales bacterium]
MKPGLNLIIAWGLLRARVKQSVVAGVGVTFGIAMFITLTGFMTGLNDLLDGLIINRTAHVRLYNEVKPAIKQPIEYVQKYDHPKHFISSIKPKEHGKEIYDAPRIMESISKDPRVSGVAPKVVTQVFFNAGEIEIAGVVNGIDVLEEDRLFAFSDNVLEGQAIDLDHVSNSIFLGKGLADKMLVKKGDVIQVSTPRGDFVLLKIVGLFQVGLADFDNTQSYTSMETIQKLLGKPASYITDIQVKLNNIEDAPDMAKEFANIYHTDAVDIQTANAQFETGTDVRNIISFAVSIVLLIVAGFGIYNILNMMIYEKMDSIAIMKATGFSGSDVKQVFLFLSMIIGVSGGIAGLLLGFTLSSIVDNIPFVTAALPKINTFPVNFNPVYYGIGIVFALVTTYIAGLFPARKASHIDPVIIIRGK